MAAILKSSNFQLLTRNPVIRYHYRTAYYVLLPEIPHDTAETNPVLRTHELVDYKTVSAETCLNAVAKLSLEQESGIWKLENQLTEPGSNVTFKSLMDPIEKLSAPLDAAWGVARTLYVTDSEKMPSETYKQIHKRARKSRSLKFQSKPIYEACKSIMNENKKLDQRQLRLLNKYILEGRLNGSELNESGMKNYIEMSRKLEYHKANFQQKVEKATNRFSHVITDPATVRDFPSELLRATALDSLAPSRGPWKITLQPHIYSSFMEHCPDPLLRWNVWQAHRARGSSSGDTSLTTSLDLEEIRYQRRDQVKLLGYPSFAAMSMETKMAGSVGNVTKMIELLLEKAFPAQEKELTELESFARERGFDGSLHMWDVPYWRRKQVASLCQHEEGDIREYFPLPRVLTGLLALIEDIFNIHFELIDQNKTGATAWHPDVSLYAVRHADGKLIGHFYFDPFSRIGRKLLSREAANWMISTRSRSDVVNHTPVASVVMNFTPNLHGIPSLLSFHQVQTLLAKMGHALQHLLTESPYSEVAGLTNLEWDAVQISAQFFQFWSSDWTTMSKISGHFESGQPLAKETLNQLNKAAVHMSGHDLCQQLYLSALDLELYSTREFWLDIVKRLWPRFQRFPLEKLDAQPCNFTDIVSQDMAAAYYSHTWSKMVAADIFSAFQEAGMEDRDALRTVGERFRNVVLANGGAVAPSETFRQFRGRDPSPDALLTHAKLN
ncbi:probable cytosolic oligopeptidase A [Daphnia pulicaria]|uniref:probable cytosolic oligopeptidase A n=1 Tax=Daphnia pulicaria TaxID=35523 RepID=UPI001EEA67E0|nr:probable cytosolic oligopeptidase A [Daphnia pulicaria]